MAYATARAQSRRIDEPQARPITLHALDDNSYASGALDTVCGRRGVIQAGDWVSGHPDNCQKCTQILAADEEMRAAS